MACLITNKGSDLVYNPLVVAAAAVAVAAVVCGEGEVEEAGGEGVCHKGQGLTSYLVGFGTGKSRARDAALNAIQSPLLDVGIKRATGIVWNITGGSDLTLFEVNAAAEVIYDLVDPNANLIFGAVVDESYSGQVSITLIVTGFKGHVEGERQVSLPSITRPPQTLGNGSPIDVPDFLKRRGLLGKSDFQVWNATAWYRLV
ncbi:hypothetical protein L7F22_022163 [Adiantum nelumboides]|nr:hypothetical protein [Adiantum nelumboides]